VRPSRTASKRGGSKRKRIEGWPNSPGRTLRPPPTEAALPRVRLRANYYQYARTSSTGAWGLGGRCSGWAILFRVVPMTSYATASGLRLSLLQASTNRWPAGAMLPCRWGWRPVLPASGIRRLWHGSAFPLSHSRYALIARKGRRNWPKLLEKGFVPRAPASTTKKEVPMLSGNLDADACVRDDGRQNDAEAWPLGDFPASPLPLACCRRRRQKRSSISDSRSPRQMPSRGRAWYQGEVWRSCNSGSLLRILMDARRWNARSLSLML
jgi:hypothetical protein